MYRQCGVNPKKYPPTHEALAKRLLKGNEWPNINPIVDIYLANQVEHLLPHGGHDLRKLDGNMRLRRSSGGESFSPLGAGQKLSKPGRLCILTVSGY